jgi:hypothetical protein
MMSDAFTSSMGMWSLLDVTAYLIIIWISVLLVFQRKAL